MITFSAAVSKLAERCLKPMALRGAELLHTLPRASRVEPGGQLAMRLKPNPRSGIVSVCAWLVAIAVVAAGTAQQKRAMTFMDVIEMRSVGAGKISPDGKYVVYTVSIPQWKVGKNFTDVFVAATDGSVPPRQMTDRKSTRLNSSHGYISYAVFCLKKKKKN